MTTGHAATVFLIGLASIPIYIAGLLLCFVGVIVSAMWVNMTFASLYYAVIRSNGRRAVQRVEASEPAPV